MSDLGEIKSLQDRIARIEGMVKEIQGQLGLEQKGSGWWGGGDDDPGEGDPLADPEIQDLLVKGNKIQAIKVYRERTGEGLKEAKDAIERWEAERGR